MALEVELVLLHPADVELLSGGATLELAGDVFLVVADNPVAEVSLYFLLGLFLCKSKRGGCIYLVMI